MLSVYVSVPITCFRKGAAREYLETEDIPPPATCYGFLLSLVGETDRRRHCGARVTCSLLRCERERSVVLRTVWRVKKTPLGSAGNTRPDYQQLLTGIELLVWLDSSNENESAESLESRVRTALDRDKRAGISRFGGLSLGESTHLVNDVRLAQADAWQSTPQTYVLAERGRLTLPVWVDHVGSQNTRYVTGDLVETALPPTIEQIPQVVPPDEAK